MYLVYTPLAKECLGKKVMVIQQNSALQMRGNSPKIILTILILEHNIKCG